MNAHRDGLLLRMATLDDADAAAALLQDMDARTSSPLVGGHPQAMTSSDIRQLLRRMAEYPFFKLYLLEEGGIAVGSFSLLVFAGASHSGCAQGVLDGVVVRAEDRGRGLGGYMLARAAQLAREQGCYKLMLSSNLRRIDAHRFYRRLGYRVHGVSLAIDP